LGDAAIAAETSKRAAALAVLANSAALLNKQIGLSNALFTNKGDKENPPKTSINLSKQRFLLNLSATLSAWFAG